MVASIVYLVLSAGVPYYLLLEKIAIVKNKHIFLISGVLLLIAIIMSNFIPNVQTDGFVITALISALITIYKAIQTTNFYKFGYYLMFVNAPFFLLFEQDGAMYSLSLLICLSGLFFIAKFYEKNYGSANYRHITGITLVRPYIGTYLTFYLIALALYPPFPNSLYFLGYIFNSEPNLLWSTVIVTLFIGNFYLAMTVMRKTLFGRPNSNIHYVHMAAGEKAMHTFIVMVLLALSIDGFKEMLL